MAPPVDAATGGSNSDYRVLPLVISEEYGVLPPAKLSLWDGQSGSWILVLNENLNASVGVRYTIRGSGIHIMAIQKLDDPISEQAGESLQPQFGRLSSLVFRKPPDAGPVLYNVKKVPRDPRRPNDSRCLRLDFRVFDGGFVFGIEPSEADSSILPAFAKGAKLALSRMLDARAQLCSFQKNGEPFWLRLETSQILQHWDDSLTALWSSKADWLGVNERVLPWMDTDNTGAKIKTAGAHPPTIATKPQVSTRPKDTRDDYTIVHELKATPEGHSGDPAITNQGATSAPSVIFPYLETSLLKVDVFYWEPGVQDWTRILPEKVGTTFRLFINFQLLSDGVELGLLHQVPQPRSNPNPSGNSIEQVLGSIKWHLGGKIATNIQYYIRMREDGKGNQLPVFYINLPELFDMKTSKKGGQIFDGMIDVADEIFVEAKLKTQSESFSNRWLCVKASNTQNQALAMEILQREDSPYSLCRSAAIPRRSRV
ncbi:hypothetical protein TWF281_006793 [Arthrobotrys megalospora]